MPMPGEPMLSRQAAALILREQYRAYASARRIGDSVVAWKALEWAHIVAQPYMGAHLASHWRMRSEEQPSELQSLMPISYAVFCLQNNKNTTPMPDNRRDH